MFRFPDQDLRTINIESVLNRDSVFSNKHHMMNLEESKIETKKRPLNQIIGPAKIKKKSFDQPINKKPRNRSVHLPYLP